jgi:hypothetical protein
MTKPFYFFCLKKVRDHFCKKMKSFDLSNFENPVRKMHISEFSITNIYFCKKNQIEQ